MMEALERQGVHLPSLVIYMMNFLVLWVVLHFVAFKPFMRRLRERTEKEERQQAEKKETQRLLEEAEQARDLAPARGREAGQKHLTQARDQILRETLHARQTLYHSFVELVMAASERVLARAVDEELRQKLMAEAILELSGLEQASASLIPKGWAVVTTSMQLHQEQGKKISECLAQLAGRSVRILFEIDPSVLGDISVHTGDALADATLRGRLERLRGHLLSQG